MHPSWKQALANEFRQPYFRAIVEFVNGERRAHTVCPPEGEVFTALIRTPLDQVRVVILGQDPYHGPGQAHGLAFSVKPSVGIPPSLANIYKEMETDLGIPPTGHGHLASWADQGVLLLNSVLTVRAYEAGSHQGHGWETLTDAIVKVLNDRETPTVFILWGRHARQKGAIIDRARHVVIESSHPSPMSASNGFFGSRPFSQTNQALEARGLAPIDWRLP